MSADEKYILNTLLDKYEASSLFRTGSSPRRVMIRVAEDKVIARSLERPYEADLFTSALSHLKAEGFIEYDYEKGQRLKIVEHIYLRAENVSTAYDYLSRPSLESLLESFLDVCSNCTFRDALIEEHMKGVQESIRSRRRFPSPFSKDDKHNRDLLKALSHLDRSPDEVLERVFSSRLFQDSKHFENEVKSDLISILHQIDPQTPPEELLKGYGIVRYPEIMEFTGALKMGGIDYSSLTYGAYMNSTTIWKLEEVETSATEVLTIENKANYIDYLQKRGEREIVIYTGGFPSPALLRLLSLIAGGRKDIIFTHWSDIDIGGFRIFLKLQEVIPSLTPRYMDSATLLKHMEVAMPIKSDEYLKELGKLLDDEHYASFHEVIRLMIRERIRLEQEALLS